MNKMFEVKDITYDLRDPNIVCQLTFNKITYGTNTISYYGTRMELITQQYKVMYTS